MYTPFFPSTPQPPLCDELLTSESSSCQRGIGPPRFKQAFVIGLCVYIYCNLVYELWHGESCLYFGLPSFKNPACILNGLPFLSFPLFPHHCFSATKIYFNVSTVQSENWWTWILFFVMKVKDVKKQKKKPKQQKNKTCTYFKTLWAETFSAACFSLLFDWIFAVSVTITKTKQQQKKYSWATVQYWDLFSKRYSMEV